MKNLMCMYVYVCVCVCMYASAFSLNSGIINREFPLSTRYHNVVTRLNLYNLNFTKNVYNQCVK